MSVKMYDDGYPLLVVPIATGEQLQCMEGNYFRCRPPYRQFRLLQYRITICPIRHHSSFYLICYMWDNLHSFSEICSFPLFIDHSLVNPSGCYIICLGSIKYLESVRSDQDQDQFQHHLPLQNILRVHMDLNVPDPH